MVSTTLQYALFIINIGLVNFLQASSVYTTPIINFGPSLITYHIPSFVIAEKGIQHVFESTYSDPFVGIDQDADGNWVVIEYDYHYRLLSAPDGMNLDETGNLIWIPSVDLIGQSVSIQIEITVKHDAEDIYTDIKNFSTNVIKSLPKLRRSEPIIFSERKPIGWSRITFSNFQPTDYDRNFFRWSLIGAPAGVYIDNEGGLRWPDDRGYARIEPYTFIVRIDYNTASGWVSDEITYSRIVLPKPAITNYTQMRTFIQPQENGLLGFSLDAVDGWLAAGEPFPSFVWSGSGNPNYGRVRLWETVGNNFTESDILQPQSGRPGQAFGASVALAPSNIDYPVKLVVGAPEASRISNSGSKISAVGYVYVFRYEENVWIQEARLDPPIIKPSLYFGGWVDINDNTLIASIEGMDSAGQNTGGLAIYRFDGNDWQYSQILEAPNASIADYFSYPCSIDENWIAAAANEDDDGAENAGAVHLFQLQDDDLYVHHQKIQATRPEANALFGEKLLLKDPWLFVSSFRQSDNTGAVHVYRRNNKKWTFHQTLTSPFSSSGSAFGVGLSSFENTLAISAPGYLFNSTEIDGSNYPWYGITLFCLKDGNWQWLRQVSRSPESKPRIHTWGYSLAQISNDLTIASMPDHRPKISDDFLPFAGRLFLHIWPEMLTNPFSEVLTYLKKSPNHSPNESDDSDGNGINNLIEWVMNQNPGGGGDSWDYFEPRARWTFLKWNQTDKELRLMVPFITKGLGYQPVIETSQDGKVWIEDKNARWESLEEVYFEQSDGANALTYFHPVLVSGTENVDTMLVRLKLRDTH